ncbi:hypothetical protein ACFWWT_23420 [Streptomyces sp. NPDC058676]
MAKYRASLLEWPELLDLVPSWRHKAPACRCAPESDHVEGPADLVAALS